MKWMIILIAVGLCMATAMSVLYVPLVPIEGFAGNRKTYQRSFSLVEIDDVFLRKHVPAVTIDYNQLTLRVGVICLVGAGMIGMCMRKMKNSKDESKP